MSPVKAVLWIAGILWILSACSKEPLPFLNILKESPIGWEIKEPCIVRYTENGKTTTITAGIKCRGGISSQYDKHSFTLELNAKHTLAGLPADDDWILNASYIDKTFMRHKLCYDLFTQMDNRNIAPRSAYVNVLINHDYAGLYVLMEEINASRTGLDKADTLAMLFKDPPVFYRDKLGYVQEPLNYYQQKYPAIGLSDKTWYMERFRDFLFRSPDEVFSRDIAQWVDLDNIADWHLLLLFTNNGDGLMKNFYLYKQNTETPFRIALWDYDHSFGRDGDNEMNMMERELDCDRSVLLKRLMEVTATGYPAILRDRWADHRAAGILTTENLQKMVEQNSKLIRQEVIRNFEKWPVDSKWYFDDNNFAEEVELLLRFVELRISQLEYAFSTP